VVWGERLFREGDRVMQTRNDYDVVWEKADGTVGTGMFNGDVGKIAQIDPSGELDDRPLSRTAPPPIPPRCSRSWSWPTP
jgi:hypothetical protein